MWYIVVMVNGPKQSENCMVCGAALEYLRQADGRTCTYCGTRHQAHVVCPEGHFVCDNCHGADARTMIEKTVLAAESKDPAAIAEIMMGHAGLPLLGCEHAFIAAGSLMAAIRNSPYGRGKIDRDEISEVFARTAKQAVGGFCGLTGVCGIVPALGACFSVFLGARCGSDSEQRITMEAVTRISRVIADLTGPSCCKAYVRAGLAEAAAVFSERFGINFPVKNEPITCRHSEKHPHGCREERCPYYRRPAEDIFSKPGFVPGTVCVS